MTSETRAKMVAGAADLMSRRGVNGTSMRDMVRHTGTPRGSISHHFPRGKQQLVEEAIVFAGAQVSGPLEHLTRERGAIAGLRTFIALWRQTLEKTKFQAGCPVLAVAVEQFVNDATERDGKPDQAAQSHLLDLADGVFADWQRIMVEALRSEGVTPARARRLAALVIASVEGTVAMCRAARSAQPLEDVRLELELALFAAISG
ncbi:TetR/AcrR family transcriptional regulator [Bradyrhizobium sp. AUGA SZCCT0222]|uniref:TetR/AcrR family transcriptional regulator n=1 Tax=Bradyrhizobium sp. AUGA SZCCT0222 TaxID=2807668 RepID=UPI001BA56EE2|nr:helix-turn-helix domain-containing protein [Bradyrhizobium sp. AUGA SZCCT0222]MBR1267138.1 TetR/AcrR family transcriptional regulator [Bradyrhizobium sp. AUGA SZCCT0222]